MSLKGRLDLETVRVPHTDRHGFLWLSQGRLVVEDGNFVFSTAGFEDLEAGAYDIPTNRSPTFCSSPAGW